MPPRRPLPPTPTTLQPASAFWARGAVSIRDESASMAAAKAVGQCRWRSHGKAAFAVLVSAPAVTVGQQGVWSDFSSGGARMPSESAVQMNAAVRADHSGYEPA